MLCSCLEASLLSSPRCLPLLSFSLTFQFNKKCKFFPDSQEGCFLSGHVYEPVVKEPNYYRNSPLHCSRPRLAEKRTPLYICSFLLNYLPLSCLPAYPRRESAIPETTTISINQGLILNLQGRTFLLKEEFPLYTPFSLSDE